jgi:hypothetical protein
VLSSNAVPLYYKKFWEELAKVRVNVTLRPTTSRSVSPGFKAHEGLTTGYLFLLAFTNIVLSITGAPSDVRSGLAVVIVSVRPLLVNIYRFTCNAHVTYIYIMYKAYVSPG